MEAQISQIEGEPFVNFMARFEDIEMLKAEREVPRSVITVLKTQLLKDVSAAIVVYETKVVQMQMQEKNIKVYSTSSLAYSEWTDPYRVKEPNLGPEASGIPALRQLLFKLPTKSNYQNYYNHVFRLLPRLREQARRVAEKHIEDQSYATMRQDLKQKIPEILATIRSSATILIEKLVVKPWNLAEKQTIANDIKTMSKNKWVQPAIYYQGFARMVREKGIPVNGKYYGRNLNTDILEAMLKYIDRWCATMQRRAEQLANGVNSPVRTLLTETELSINISSADPALKETAIDALRDTLRSTETAYTVLLASLLQSLRANHLHFTTEIDIHGPIALEMNPIYESSQDRRNIGYGTGIYKRQRETIVTTIIDPPKRSRSQPWIKELNPLLTTLENSIESQQKQHWESNCDTYITHVAAHLTGFHKITEDLLKNAAYTTQEHQKAQKLIKELLVDFDENLIEMQRRFTSKEVQPLRKKAKFTRGDLLSVAWD